MRGCSSGVRLVRQPEADLLAPLVDLEKFVQSFFLRCVVSSVTLKQGSQIVGQQTRS